MRKPVLFNWPYALGALLLAALLAWFGVWCEIQFIRWAAKPVIQTNVVTITNYVN